MADTVNTTDLNLNSKYKTTIDNVVLNKFEVNSSQFIFDELKIRDKVFYFTIDTNYYLKNKKLSKKKLLIGLWHSIFANEPKLFDFSRGFRYKIELNSKFYIISYLSGILETSVSDEDDPFQVDIDDCQEIVINPKKYKVFHPIRTKEEHKQEQATRKKILITKYLSSWVVVTVIFGYFIYVSYEDEFKAISHSVEAANNTKNKFNLKLKKLKTEVVKEKGKESKEGKVYLQHMVYISKFINNNVVMTGELDNQLDFSFDTTTKVEMVRYVAKKENIPIKLQYDFISKVSKVSWRVNP